MRRPRPPALVFGADGVPVAAEFADVYFSRAGGLAESEAVFLDAVGGEALWRGRPMTAIAELGFGTGLNALAVWRRWRSTRRPGAVLHFVSVEASPLDVDQASAALAAFPEIGELARRLLARWPVAAFGAQRLWFPEDGFCLTLHVGEAEPMLAGLSGPFDAWFLDGFAPARNPAMWTDAIFRRVAALSAPGARLATYTVAGPVRRGLEAAGCTLRRMPGFGAKRERLEAHLPAPTSLPPSPRPRSVLVIGAGIGGAWAAAAAKRRGLDVTVVDAAPGPGAGASGNPLALVMPRLDRGETGLTRFLRSAYLFALDAYAQLGEEAFAPCGVREIARDGRAAALADLLADPPLPEALIRPHPSGALHPKAGVVRPAAALAALTRDVTIRWGCHVAGLVHDGEGWSVLDAAGEVLARADAVVVAAGAQLAALPQTASLPLTWSRGQVDWMTGAGLSPEPARAAGPYAAVDGGTLLFGATFDPLAAVAPVEADGSSTDANLAALASLAPDWRAAVNVRALQSRASVRAAPPDRAPIAGMAPDAAAFVALHARGRSGADSMDVRAAPRLPGLFILGGLGARGFMTAPLLAEVVIADMMGEPPPLDSAALAAVHPARFLVRARKRGQLQKGAGEAGEASDAGHSER